MNNLMFSILVPVYNQEKCLNRSLSSILNQSYKNFEVIIVDDNSKDGSYQMIKDYASKDNRIKYYKNFINRGVGFTRNKLLKIAKGKYILFVDPDDYIELDLLKIITKYAEKDFDIIRFQNIVNPVTEEQIIIENTKDSSRFCCKVEKINSGIDAVKKWDMGLIYINASLWSYCFKKNIFTDNNITFKNVRIHEDYSVLPMILLNSSKIEVINYVGYHYLQYDNTLTKLNSNNKKNIIKKLKYKNKIFINETKRIVKYLKRANLPNSFKEEFILDLNKRLNDQNRKFINRINDLK